LVTSYESKVLKKRNIWSLEVKLTSIYLKNSQTTTVTLSLTIYQVFLKKITLYSSILVALNKVNLICVDLE